MTSTLLREMDGPECRALLARQRVCVISMVDGTEPYAVPVFYGLDTDTLVLGLSEGRKTRVLEANPRVCATVVEVEPDGVWRSVQARGVARLLDGDAERAAAIETLKAHNRRLGHAPPAAIVHRPVAPGRLVRIEGAVITGRARA